MGYRTEKKDLVRNLHSLQLSLLNTCCLPTVSCSNDEWARYLSQSGRSCIHIRGLLAYSPRTKGNYNPSVKNSEASPTPNPLSVASPSWEGVRLWVCACSSGDPLRGFMFEAVCFLWPWCQCTQLSLSLNCRSKVRDKTASVFEVLHSIAAHHQVK